MMCGSIYKIQFPNGKHYIGLTTTSLEQRKKEHEYAAKKGDTRCVYNALRKYGIDTFEIVEIDTADTIEELYEKEITYIKEYNSYYKNKNGYNMTLGGEGVNGYVFSEEDKQKASEITKKYFENPEKRQKQSELLKKYFESPEKRKEMSEIKKKYYKENPEAGKDHGERMKNYYKENPEARQKASEITKKYFENPEARQKASEITKKYFKSPEKRQKQSEIKKKYFEENPEAGKEHSERLKKYFEENPTARQKNREALKKHYEENPTARQKVSDGKGKNKPFDIFTTNGTFIKTFNYQFEAIEYLQKEHHITTTINICAVLNGRRKSSAGFVFTYKK